MTRCHIALALIVLFSIGAAPVRAGFADRYYQLHYDYEVAAQCGLVSIAVEDAFRAKRRDADAMAELSAEGLKKIRLKAYVAAAREYDNRGLGGYKSWCLNEARAGVRRLQHQDQ